MKTRIITLLVLLTLVAFTTSANAQGKVEVAPTAGNNAVEGGANGTFTIGLDSGATFNHRVTYTMSGSATEGVDYTISVDTQCINDPGTANPNPDPDPLLVDCPGGYVDVPEDKNAASSVTLTIVVIDDADIENVETVIITLNTVNPGGNVELATNPVAQISLTSDDVLGVPEVTIAATTQASEPSTNGLFTVTSNTVAGVGGLTVNYAVDGASTATAGVDYTALSGSVVIAEGDTTATIDVTVSDDVDVEGTESVIVNLSADAAYTVGSPATGTVDIADNDTLPEVTIVATTQASEPSTNGLFTVTSNIVAGVGGLTVNYAVDGASTATAGVDYTALSGSVVIAEGDTTATIDVTVSDDVDIEGTESVIVNLSADAAYTVGSPATATVDIADDDSLPEVTIVATTQASEPSTNGLFTVTSNIVAGVGGLTVNYAVDGASTATAGVDYTALSGSVVIAEGDTTATIDVTVSDDVDIEGTESVIVNLSADAAYTVGSPATATVDIADDDSLPEVTIVATTQASEPSTNGLFTVTSNIVAGVGGLTVNYAVDGASTATAGVDYTALSGSVVIAEGDTTATIDVTVSDDVDIEGTESVIVNLAADAAYTVGSPATATVDIADDDSPPEVTIVATTQASEPSTNGLFTVTSNIVAGVGGLTVNYAVDGASTATAGVDYTALSGSVLIAEGDTTATIDVTVSDDVDVEGTESVIVNLAADAAYTVGSPATATVDIADNETLPEVTIVATTQASEPSTNGLFTVTSNTVAGVGGLTVNYAVDGASTATAGVDYTALSGSVLIAEGDTTATIDVTVSDDVDVEGTESVIVNLAADAAYTVGSPATATVNIADDEQATPEVTIVATTQASEPSTNGLFTVTSNTVAGVGGLTVNYAVDGASTATAGVDYTALSGSVLIAEGDTTATIDVTVSDDVDVEGTESVIVNLAADAAYTVGSPATATVDIADNETLPEVTIVATTQASEPSTNGLFTVTSNIVAVVGGLTVNYTVDGASTATAGVDYTALSGSVVIAEGDTTATIDVTVSDDVDIEGTESVIVNLAADATYTVGSPATATVDIADDDGLQSIPTLSEWAMILLSILFLMMGLMYLRRRQTV